MLIACWSAKGGAGTTTVATSLALGLSARAPQAVLLADFGGDVPAVAGLPTPDSPGLAGWLGAGDAVQREALDRLQEHVTPALSLLPRGAGQLAPARARSLAEHLHNRDAVVVADCGCIWRSDPHDAAASVAAAAAHSWLVIRPDYLSLHHAAAAPIRPTAAVIVSQPARSLGAEDVERVLGVSVLARLDDDPAVARAVDAGMMSGRLPRSIERALRPALDCVAGLPSTPAPSASRAAADRAAEASL